MQRKGPETELEILLRRLADAGYEIETLRQPVHPTPGYVTFGDPSLPNFIVKIKVFKRFLELQEDLVKRIAEAEKELELERECRKKQKERRDGSTD